MKMKKIFTLLLAGLCAANVMATNEDNIIRYDFEDARLNSDNQYYEWYENGETGFCSSGNAGFAFNAQFMNPQPTPEEYPTVAVTDGYAGKCVKLETKSTGNLGAIVGMGIAAGNLFMGDFDMENLADAVKATKFGKPFYKKPIKFTGYYKYAAGEKMQDGRGKAVEGTDQGRIYSVLYRNADSEGKAIVLNGEDVLTNENIVAVADAGEITDAAEWTLFDAEFEYKEGKVIDEDILKAGGYSMATVFTSSSRGASFIGAVGSTLYIDKVAIECEPEPKEFKGNLTVTMGESSMPQSDVSIFITEQTDGKYTLSLRNFMFAGQGIGTITLKDVEGTEDNGTVKLQSSQNVAIEPGDDPNVEDWVGPSLGALSPGGIPVGLTATMSDDNLTATITINMLGGINVQFEGNVTSGMSDVVSNDKSSKIIGVYTIGGAKVNNMQPGQVYILRKADGTSVKVIKK